MFESIKSTTFYYCFISCVIYWSLILVINIWRAFSCLLRSSELEAGSRTNCTGNEIQSSCLKYKLPLSLPYFPHSYTPALLLSSLSCNTCLFVCSRLAATSTSVNLLNLTLSTLHSRSFSLLHHLLLLLLLLLLLPRLY